MIALNFKNSWKFCATEISGHMVVSRQFANQCYYNVTSSFLQSDWYL